MIEMREFAREKIYCIKPINYRKNGQFKQKLFETFDEIDVKELIKPGILWMKNNKADKISKRNRFDI